MKKLHILFFLFQLYSLKITAQCSYADFSYATESDGCGISFTDTSDPAIGARTWDFGDGQIRNIHNGKWYWDFNLSQTI